ncbi:LOW QUALITY PROTEIN: NEDD8 ultimate buster 1 [Lethenteron reissneri]|uniref:LOW QUALITY PROTEIN: NEDD8 ultimate buster 1 n=1 Tax=Lethenteron reissneri TaxID=7753 RepID=UPI002AB6F4E4|nr:LOW QUALITY PROTEIN: NEDD8 ultimate buster 1 [Lethenteron reissneri]
METGSLLEEHLQVRVRDALRRDGVKLWLEPYTESGGAGAALEELGARYSSELSAALSMVLASLETLRLHALRRLHEQAAFKQSGLATLRYRMARPGGGRLETGSLETRLDITGQQLKATIGQLCDIPSVNLKLISAGRIIEDGRSLQEQGVRPAAQIMVVPLMLTERQAHESEEQQLRLARTRQGAQLLADIDDDSEAPANTPYLQIADQKGNPIQIPQQEKKALMLAMSLHEKGRAMLKRGEHSSALLLLLDADREFKQCRSELLSAVDNFAVLCLDVVWAYLRLQSLDALPDAHDRLVSAQATLNKCYGVNLERLYSLKGSSGREQALFLRLYLLQGIVWYHQGNSEQAIHHLSQAETLLSRLAVDGEKLAHLVSLGFTPQEARLGLRACEGNLEMAATHVMQRREERRAMREREREERRQARRMRRYGRTAGGHWVDTDSLRNLRAMGFASRTAAEALRQADNDVHRALQILEDHPELLALSDNDADEESVDVTEELLLQVMALGFDYEMAERALRSARGNLQRAVDALVTSGGVLPPSTSSSSSSSSATTPTDGRVRTEEEARSEREAMEEVTADVPEHEEDYLDSTLQEEAEILQTYQTLLAQARTP